MVRLERGKHYSLVINHHGRILEYEGKVVAFREGEFVLKSENACNLIFRLKDVLKVKEIKPKKLDPVIILRKKVDKSNLREPDKPKGL